jgi:predicted dithiol-disulfide oxidoreductase (DUF899 family)
MDDPRVVERDEWIEARLALLAEEKALTKQRDSVSAARRRLPMVEIDEDYTFAGAGGSATLLDLFGGRSQLLTYHFMWLFDVGLGCPSCSYVVDNIGDPSHLYARDTSLAVITRGPFDETDAYRARMGWSVPWYSSFSSTFNYDFHVSLDDSIAPVEYNYRDLAALGEDWQRWSGEQPGVSAFLRHGDRVFHTYSSYGRGLDPLVGTYQWLDLTARGRQEDWEEPPGRSSGGAMSWLRRHDEYDAVH